MRKIKREEQRKGEKEKEELIKERAKREQKEGGEGMKEARSEASRRERRGE